MWSGDRRAGFRRTRPGESILNTYNDLCGYPTWHAEDVADADAFVRSATPKVRTARFAGSEVDAAIDDPRWKAKGI